MTATVASPSPTPTVAPVADDALVPGSPGASALATTMTFAGRTIKQFIRTPQLIVLGATTNVMFLLIFRYVFGGAVGTGSVSYADFLIPGLAAAGACFAGMGTAVGVAEDIDGGIYDRLRSLPVPRSAVMIGRSLADTALLVWTLAVTVAVGFATGFRFHGSLSDAVIAVLLCVAFGAAFTWPFIAMGLVAGNAQSANGMSMLVFPLVFVSSAYVPVESMPGWLQAFADNQPVTVMVNAVRSLSLGDDAAELLPHSTSWYVVRALLWSGAIAAVFIPVTTRLFAKR